MQDLIIYLLKSAGLISLFYTGYYFLLKNDTGFKANRIFLLAGIVTSLLLPSLEITRTIEVESSATPFFPENFSTEVFTTPAAQPETIDWWQIAGMIYLIGLGFFLLKFLLELFSLLKLIFSHKAIRQEGYYLIHKSGNTLPFSFFNYIVLYPAQHTPAELEMILKHEQSHVRHWHSIDQLLTSLSVYLLWFNPLAWLYRKSVVQNLEYLADKEVIATQVSKKEYQKTLLKISVANFQPALTNQFYQSFIKKRIIMLNKNNIQKSNFWKTSLLLPFLSLFIFLFNVQTVAQVVNPEDVVSVTTEIEIRVTISESSTRKNLSQFERIFKRRGVDLNFKNFEYSKDGLLTAISVSYQNKEKNQSGSFTLNDPRGIEATVIYTNNKETGFGPAKDSSDLEKKSVFGELGNEPLFIIANKEYDAKTLLGKKIKVTGEMKVLNPKEAKARFGRKAAKGAVILSEALILNDIKDALKHMDLQKRSLQSTFIEVRKDSAPILFRADIKVSETKLTTPLGFSANDFQYNSKETENLKNPSEQTENENSRKNKKKFNFSILTATYPIFKENKNTPLSVRDVGSADPDSSKLLYDPAGK